MNGRFQVYELNKGNLKLAYERETDAGIKCCTFGASSLEERHLVSYSGLRTFGTSKYIGISNMIARRLNVAGVWRCSLAFGLSFAVLI